MKTKNHNKKRIKRLWRNLDRVTLTVIALQRENISYGEKIKRLERDVAKLDQQRTELKQELYDLLRTNMGPPA